MNRYISSGNYVIHLRGPGKDGDRLPSESGLISGFVSDVFSYRVRGHI